jgi:two-component system OmpR family sensor kinase/two-component system sensor histidine kinase BaeS
VTEIAIVLGVTTLLVGLAAALLVRYLPTVRLQLSALAILAVGLPLGAVLTSGWVMFHMHDDVKILAVSAAAALSALIGSLLVARWIVLPIERLRDASNRLAGGDLTARAPVLARPAELSELAGSFNEMAANLEETFDARRQLVAWASHDLRTPVAALKAMIEALSDGLARPEEYLPALHEQIDGLALLIDDLFELAAIDAGALTLELRTTGLGEIVETCLRAVDAQARVRNVRLESRIDDATPKVTIAPDKVERVLLNLLTNALRHTPSDGSVAVIVEPADRNVRIAVEDTGDGLPLGRERLFDGFWKADGARSRSDGGGAGLGLAIARGIVEAHGGTIWAESRADGGARVVFALPTATG